MARRTERNARPGSIPAYKTIPAGKAIPAEPASSSGTPLPGPGVLDSGNLVSLLGAFSFLLSAIEYSLPKPLPFMRLGIANLPLLLAVDLLPFPAYLLLALVKVIGMGLVSGTLFSYVALFSTAGSLAAALAMWATRRAGGLAVSLLGVSVAGAMASSAVQILLARAMIFGEAAWYVAPLFLATSLLTGGALGLFASRFAAASSWYAGRLLEGHSVEAAAWKRGEAAPGRGDGVLVAADAASTATKPVPAAPPKRASSLATKQRAAAWDARFDPRALAIAGAFLALTLLFLPDLAVKACLVLLLAIATLISGRRIRVGTGLLVSVGIVLANLAIPVGRILARLGPLVITETALLEGLSKALVFQGLIFASLAAIRPGLHIPGRLGALVSEAFVCYQRLVDGGIRLRPGHFVEDADALLTGLERDFAEESMGTGARKEGLLSP